MRRTIALFLALVALIAPALAQEGKPVFTREVLRTQDAAKRLDIDVAYPSVTIPGALMGVQGNARDFNAKMKALAEDMKAAYLADLAEYGPQSPDLPGENALKVDYEVVENTGRLVALKFDHYQNMAGAAHPTSAVRTVNYDLGGGELTLAGLFKPGADYLPVIASTVRAGLEAEAKKHDGYPLFDEALAPKADNFQNFLITDAGLVFYFDQGTVAPGFAGVQHATVPWSKVRGMLSQEASWVLPR